METSTRRVPPKRRLRMTTLGTPRRKAQRLSSRCSRKVFRFLELLETSPWTSRAAISEAFSS